MVLTARGDVELLDPMGETGDSERRDEIDIPAVDDDIAFTTGDWLGLLKPMGTPMGAPEGDGPKRWRRLSAMVAAISGIALAVTTFSLGGPVANEVVSLATSAGAADSNDGNDQGGDEAGLAVPKVDDDEIALLVSAEMAVLSRLAPPDTTSTTEATTTTVGWSEPVIPPESEWVNTGNGVMVPDVLLRIRFCESTNNYQARHAVSSARGAYQFLTKSWEWYGHAARYGVASADLATPAQQDEAALRTLQRDGTRPWLASWGCWGSDSIPSNYATAKPRPQPTTTSTTEANTTSSESTDTTADGSTSSSESTSSTQASTSSTTDTTTSSSTSESTTSTTSGSTTSSDSTGSSSTSEAG